MKLGVREICDVVLKAKAATTIGNHTFKAGEPVIYFDTLKTSTLEGAATTVYAQGGRGNSRLLAWEGERTLTFTMEDALISPKSFAILSGAGLMHADTTQKVIAHTTNQVQLTAEDITNKKLVIKDEHGNVIKASQNAEASAYIMLLDGNGEMSGVPVKSKVDTEGAIELEDGLFIAGDVVLVDFYKEYESDAVEITISADKFAGYYYLEASTLFRREADGVDLPAEFIIPKAKIQSAFTFTMASSGDPSTFTFTMDALPDYTKFNKEKKVLCAIQVLEADDNFDIADKEENGEVNYTRATYNKDGTDKNNPKAAYLVKNNKYQTTDDAPGAGE